MKGKWRNILFILLLPITIVLFKAIQENDKLTKNLEEKQSEDIWQTFSKETSTSITTYPSTEKEKREQKLDTSSQQILSPQRLPATQKKPTPLNKAERKFYNFQNLQQKIDISDITITNQYNPQWREKMGKNLLRFLRPQTKLFVKVDEKLTLVTNNQGRLVEKVTIKMTSPEGRRYGHQALVDSQTGEILRTWNQTIHEPMNKHHESLQLSPSGGFKSDGKIKKF